MDNSSAGFLSSKHYNDYPSYIKKRFGERVQKVSLNTGFTCPNRDGTKGTGGCTYCNNNTFSPDYCKPDKSIGQQLDEGIAIFAKRQRYQKFLAYFQSYTNTYAPYHQLEAMYREALSHPQVVGMVVGTRPDCIDEKTIDLLEQLAQEYYVSLEFGVESTLNSTLKRVNRCHTFEETQAAYALASNKGIHLGAHLIIGLPGESRKDILEHALRISDLPINTLKLHQLQIVKHTVMALQYKDQPDMFHLYTVEEYIDLITDFVALLRTDIIIERFISQAPHHLLIAPVWGLKNFEIVDKVEKRLVEKGLWQGKMGSWEVKR
ncbi:MAG: TIGR01212 family radical SAM protein [Cyclobacteriaceae bacterium]|nr:TIGR01212 family radical SAM protein [Cyclobacteriaceae bacterium]